MLGRSRLEDVLMLVIERPISFTDYEPRDVPGFTSDIAHVFGCSENQTKRLLDAVDTLADDHHFSVVRTPVGEVQAGSKGKVYPRKLNVTVSPA